MKYEPTEGKAHSPNTEIPLKVDVPKVTGVQLCFKNTSIKHLLAKPEQSNPIQYNISPINPVCLKLLMFLSVTVSDVLVRAECSQECFWIALKATDYCRSIALD